MSCTAYMINIDGVPTGHDSVTYALSKWLNVPFQRVWQHGGNMLGVAADGVYLIGGASTYACALELSPIKSPGDEMMRMHYATINSKGAATFTAMYDGVAGATVASEHNNNRVKFGRGSKGRRIGLKVTSTDSDFKLLSVQLFPEVLSRRVQ